MRSIIEVMKGDTRSLDYSSNGPLGIINHSPSRGSRGPIHNQFWVSSKHHPVYAVIYRSTGALEVGKSQPPSEGLECRVGRNSVGGRVGYLPLA